MQDEKNQLYVVTVNGSKVTNGMPLNEAQSVAETRRKRNISESATPDQKSESVNVVPMLMG